MYYSLQDNQCEGRIMAICTSPYPETIVMTFEKEFSQ
jgi:hypothetical protein